MGATGGGHDLELAHGELDGAGCGQSVDERGRRHGLDEALGPDPAQQPLSVERDEGAALRQGG